MNWDVFSRKTLNDIKVKGQKIVCFFCFLFYHDTVAKKSSVILIDSNQALFF